MTQFEKALQKARDSNTKHKGFTIVIGWVILITMPAVAIIILVILYAVRGGRWI